MKNFLMCLILVSFFYLGCGSSELEIKNQPLVEEYSVKNGNVDLQEEEPMDLYFSTANVEKNLKKIKVVNCLYDEKTEEIVIEVGFEKPVNISDDFIEITNAEGDSLGFFLTWKKTLVTIKHQEYIIIAKMIISIDGDMVIEAYLVPYFSKKPENKEDYEQLYQGILNTNYQESATRLKFSQE